MADPERFFRALGLADRRFGLGLRTFNATGLPEGISGMAIGCAALAVLVVSCPCALGLRPKVIAASVSRPMTSACSGMVPPSKPWPAPPPCFDKTGTLTMGLPKLAAIDPCPGYATCMMSCMPPPV